MFKVSTEVDILNSEFSGFDILLHLPKPGYVQTFLAKTSNDFGSIGKFPLFRPQIKFKYHYTKIDEIIFREKKHLTAENTELTLHC